MNERLHLLFKNPRAIRNQETISPGLLMKKFSYCNRTRFLACAVVSLFFCAHMFGQVQEAWVARYSGVENGYNEASAIAVDANGNVYVTGWSERAGTGLDYATIKYDRDGNELWVARYSGPAQGRHRARAMALDAEANVYVTGVSWGGFRTEDDYATIKYDTNGNQLWVARYDGPGHAQDVATAIAVDGSGNVYVTGSSDENGGGDYRYATIKYDAAGNQLWVARYGRGYPGASALAVDKGGNVYVTGGGFGYATIKYDANGNELWAAIYDGPGHGEDAAKAIALDADGNVYVTGKSWGGLSTHFDYTTIKYDTNGNRLWVARYDGPDHQDDVAAAVAVNHDGSVYVTGASYVTDGPSLRPAYATVKYDPNGTELWVARYVGADPGGDYANAIAIDPDGNVYVTGESDGGPSTWNDYATIKYDTNGNQHWVARYDGPGHAGDLATALALDAEGNVYVTGSSQRARGGWPDYSTIKYSPQ